MIYVILLIIMVVSLIGAISYALDGMFGRKEDENKNSKYASISILICIISIVMFFFVSYKFDTKPYIYPKEPTSIEYITALSDNQEINGKIRRSRYAIRGYFNEELYYSYMVDVGNGGKKSNKVPSNNTTIYETDRNYKVEWYTGHKEFLGLKGQKTYWKIYIPVGSITDEYNIDLE